MDDEEAIRADEVSHARPALVAAAAGLVLGLVKAVIIVNGMEFLDLGIIPGALLGGVIFTLAIVLAGVMADFKESEKGIGEVAAILRRLHWDMAYIGLGQAELTAARQQVRDLGRLLQASAHQGQHWRGDAIRRRMDALDVLLRSSLTATVSTFRTVQVDLGALLRIVVRLETIMDTRFLRAGYTFSAMAIVGIIVINLVSHLGGVVGGSIVVGLIGFVLIGLYVLVWDLDNPFTGAVRVDLDQLDATVAFLDYATQDASVVDAKPMPPVVS